MAGSKISNIATKQDLMCGANHLNVTYVSGNDYLVSGMIECAGAWYRFVEEEITVTTSDYIKVVPNADPEILTATLAAITSFAGCAFDTAKNGYYVTGTSERVFAYRDLTTTVFLIQNESQNVYTNLLVGGNTIINGTCQIVGNLKKPTTHIYDNSGTNGGIYTALSSYIPNVNDSIIINGGYTDTAYVMSLAYATRTTSSRIRLFGLLFSGTSGAVTNEDIDSGSAKGCRYSIAW